MIEREDIMLRISLFAAALLLIATSVMPPAARAAPAGPQTFSIPSNIQLVQDKKKSETVTQKVKRVWRNITTPNYDFCVSCPILIPVSYQTCTAEAKNVDDARAKCQAQHLLCSVRDKRC